METIPEVCSEASSHLHNEELSSSRGFNSLCSRCKSLGSPQLFRVIAGHRQLELHKCWLVSRSGFLSRVLKNSTQFKLPVDFPGGLQAFEATIELSLGNDENVLLDSSSIAILRCASEYLELNLGPENVCDRLEELLNRALNSWSDTIEVISSCCCNGSELVLAEELLIIHRCVESLASMICSELDPQQRWMRKTQSCRIIDVLRLQIGVFRRIISSCSRRGLPIRSLSNLLVRYSEIWLFGEGDEQDHPDPVNDSLLLQTLEGIARLLPPDRGVLPINFLFPLLRFAIAIDSSSECRMLIESRIAAQLDVATIDDLLMPFQSARQAPTLTLELESMKRIVALFMAQCRAVDSDTGLANWQPVASVVRLWDEYLAEVGYSGSISAYKFAELIDAVPGFVRVSHDGLYKAIHIFLKAHPTASQQERLAICKPLDCQKLSQEACIHVVQNELMPLRTIVQAMFVQQLHTTNQNPRVRLDEDFDNDILPLRRDDRDQGLKADLEATNSKLESLEHQLFLIRKTLQETAQGPLVEGSSSSKAGKSGMRMGRKLSKAIQRMGIISGICKGHSQVINPADRCFPMRSIYPEVEEEGEEEPLDPRRISTSSRDRDRDDILLPHHQQLRSKSSGSRRHSRRYSVS